MSDPLENGRDFCMKNSEHCIRCKDRACNEQKLEYEKPLSCIKCTPSENNNCNIIDKNTIAVECTRTVIGYKNVCYTHHTEQTITRGCLYEASESIFDICKTNSSALCTTCDQTDCNRAPITNTTTPTVTVPEKNASDDRIVQLINDEEHQLHCYQCNGTKECDSISDFYSKPMPCPISSKYDQCYTFIQHKGSKHFIFKFYLLKLTNLFTFVDQKIFRGCLSDSSNARLMCDQSEKHKLGFCDTCSGSGCNNQPKMAKPKLSCLKCNDEKICAFSQYSHDARPCQKNVLFGDKESCFTRRSDSNEFMFLFCF